MKAKTLKFVLYKDGEAKRTLMEIPLENDVSKQSHKETGLDLKDEVA